MWIGKFREDKGFQGPALPCVNCSRGAVEHWILLCVIFFSAKKLLDIEPQDHSEEDGGHMDLDAQRKGKCAVIKTSTRQVWNLCLLMMLFLLFWILVLDIFSSCDWPC